MKWMWFLTVSLVTRIFLPTRILTRILDPTRSSCVRHLSSPFSLTVGYLSFFVVVSSFL